MEHPFKMDDLGGKPTIFGNTHIYMGSWSLLNYRVILVTPPRDVSGGAIGRDMKIIEPQEINDQNYHQLR